MDEDDVMLTVVGGVVLSAVYLLAAGFGGYNNIDRSAASTFVNDTNSAVQKYGATLPGLNSDARRDLWKNKQAEISVFIAANGLPYFDWTVFKSKEDGRKFLEIAKASNIVLLPSTNGPSTLVINEERGFIFLNPMLDSREAAKQALMLVNQYRRRSLEEKTYNGAYVILNNRAVYNESGNLTPMSQFLASASSATLPAFVPAAPVKKVQSNYDTTPRQDQPLSPQQP